MRKILQIFVAFSEKLNFTVQNQSNKTKYQVVTCKLQLVYSKTYMGHILIICFPRMSYHNEKAFIFMNVLFFKFLRIYSNEQRIYQISSGALGLSYGA